MSLTVFISVLIFLQILCLWVGKRASRNLKDSQGYFLADKEVRFFPLLMTFIATQIGGGLVLGAAEEAYRFGWTVLCYPLGACLGFVVLALGVGKRLAQFQVSTVAELLGLVYQSRLLKTMASLLSMTSLFMILVAQVIASRKFMGSLGVEQTELFLVFWGIVIIYTVMGGLKAVVSIDIIQALFFITVFVGGVSYVLFYDSLSVSTLMSMEETGSKFEFSSSKLIGWLLMPLLFMVIEQDMAQRCFAARSPRVVSRAAAYAALSTFLICLIPVLFGILGKAKGVESAAGSSVFMDVAQAMTTPVISAFIGCAVLMAILSTAISLLNAVSSNLSQDFDWIRIRSAQGMGWARGMTAAIGLFALISSFYAGEIVSLLIQSYELSVCCLFVPVCAALFKKRPHARSAWCAFILGGIGFGAGRVFALDFPQEVLSVCLSALGYGIGEGWAWIHGWRSLTSTQENMQIE